MRTLLGYKFLVHLYLNPRLDGIEREADAVVRKFIVGIHRNRGDNLLGGIGKDRALNK